MEEEQVLTSPPSVWIRVDLNTRSRDGYVLARLSGASSTVVAGDQRVIAYEPDDRVAAPAQVVRVDGERGLVYLDVSWEEMDDDVVFGRMPAPIVTYVPESNTNGASDLSMRFGFVERIRARFLTGPQPQGVSAATTLPVHAMVAS